MSTATLAGHWDAIYTGRSVADLSWTRPDAGMSALLVDPLLGATADAVVDVGGGAGVLVDHLLGSGHRNVTVLDASSAALEIAQQRLQAAGVEDGTVEWVVADIVTWHPSRTYRLWHDRAVFHFLTDPADRAAYRRTAAGAVEPGGSPVVGTFAPDGPDRCSGLPVCRYSPDALAAEFAPDFTVVATRAEHHHTSRGADQSFTWVVLARRDPDQTETTSRSSSSPTRSAALRV